VIAAFYVSPELALPVIAAFYVSPELALPIAMKWTPFFGPAAKVV